ncbi:LysR family transcriptional regulator [Bacillus sp. OK048]|uniref:LysR family transcriptional regulator n=1 Tax=Bacillus sp. OK048 TaxID=1882761 RepID=UPI00088A80DF|nr:LysR family transcriptional regulator [Bacillus sp. OK048]SDM35357.1 DNA-binding transcriptional regulator, LysR family [Bacillus sp. OK048]
MEIRQLRYFIAVAEHLNFTEAAKKLFVAQPAVSQQIASLEKEIGFKLFIRDKHSVQLTHAGRVFLNDALEMLNKSEAAIKKARKAAIGEVGQISIGFLNAPVKKFLPDLVKEFRRKYPEIQINLNHYQTGQIVERLRNAEDDIAFTMSFIPQDNTEWEFKTLFSQPYVVFMYQEHPLASKDRISIFDLVDEPFVMLERKETPQGYDHLFRLFANHGFLPNIAIENTRIETVLMIVEAGLGIAVLPKHLEVYANPSLKYMEIEEWNHTVDIVVAWKKTNLNPSIPLFLKELELMDCRQ